MQKKGKNKIKINQTRLKASIPTDWASYLEPFSFSFPLALSKIIHFSFRNRTKSIFFYFSYLSKKYFLFFMNHAYNFFMVPSYNSQVVQFNDYCQLPFILNLEFYHFLVLYEFLRQRLQFLYFTHYFISIFWSKDNNLFGWHL